MKKNVNNAVLASGPYRVSRVMSKNLVDCVWSGGDFHGTAGELKLSTSNRPGENEPVYLDNREAYEFQSIAGTVPSD